MLKNTSSISRKAIPILDDLRDLICWRLGTNSRCAVRTCAEIKGPSLSHAHVVIDNSWLQPPSELYHDFYFLLLSYPLQLYIKLHSEVMLLYWLRTSNPPIVLNHPLHSSNSKIH